MAEDVQAQTPPIVMSSQDYRAQLAVDAMNQAAADRRDETVAGGRYKRGDVFVNANGDVIADATDDKKPGK